MTNKIELQKWEALPSIKEIGDKLTELIKNPEYKDIISGALSSLIEFARASEKKNISSQAKSAIETVYNLVRK